MEKSQTMESCIPTEIQKLSSTPDALAKSFKRYLIYHLGRQRGCSPCYLFEAISKTLRDRVIVNWHDTRSKQEQKGVKQAYYLSLEFLMGRALGNHLLNLDLTDNMRETLENFCLDMEEIKAVEADAGLGNGGLGRLAACFMDSCASLQLPVMGYGLHYEYGMFRQLINNGYQEEEPDQWLKHGNPWELRRPEYTQRICFGGRTEFYQDQNRQLKAHWVDTHDVLAVPYDVPISGYKNDTVNTLRLWKAAATDEFDLYEFNEGDYTESMAAKNAAENITMVLYPNDSSENGKELRLRQQYFLASASLQDILRRWELREGKNYSHFAEKNVFQMNDTHPTISVAELMRLLMDEKGLGWDEAWEITSKTMAYTNHTLLPEALEKWSVSLFQQLLPRLLDIIYEINAHFMDVVRAKWPANPDKQQQLSIIEEGDYPQVRMAHLAIVGSFSVNGVAALHSELLCKGLFKDFYELWPEKFNNKTNGVTPRRWIAHANPLLTDLIKQTIGSEWLADLSKISALKPYAGEDHDAFQTAFKNVKQANKQRLSDMINKVCGVEFKTDALFDIQVKRIHEYKRQLLNALHMIHLYNQIKQGHTENLVNRCILIGGKAAPGYVMAKSIIKLINNIANVVNNDPDVGDQLKIAFYPNYDVSSMEIIAPAADLSEQISTAGKEASGTGNMKFMMNGALTIGTYDGANIEILEQVGKENFFLFGLKADEVEALLPHYNPADYVQKDKDLYAVMELLKSEHFNALEPNIFDDIINRLLSPHDPWMTLADFSHYIEAQNQVATAWRNQEKWQRMSIMNTASSGFFSTDRTMKEYNEDIWKLEAI
ncbi:MAG: glycogen/starch/alpha-glucan phosphorylase [Thiotrichaceae bacterium]|nr:glycogen/starch/alpha-glucan phosphorylase [Thiotrichaceae bacterium]